MELTELTEKGKNRRIRKLSYQIGQELENHKGTDAEYAKVSYGSSGQYFVVHRTDYENAMRK